MSAWNTLDAELADTLQAARAGRRLPARRGPAATLARDIVGAPRPAPLGACVFCGTPAPNRSVCPAHDDLTALDAATSDVVTRNTNGRPAHSLDGKRAPDGRREEV